MSGKVVKRRGILDSLPFYDGVNPVRRDVFHDLDLSRGPAHFDRLHLRRGPEAEVQAEIVLREIAGAAANFVELSKTSGVDRDAVL